MSSNQTILDATICVYQRSFPDSTLYNFGVDLTRLAYQNNVKIGVGTDLSSDNYRADAPLYREIIALNKDVGMAPMDIIQSATMINAEMIGQEQEIGSIEVGKKANLVILNENPIIDINNIKTVLMSCCCYPSALEHI